MKGYLRETIRRRHLFGFAMAGVAAAVASTTVPERAAVKSDNPAEKRKARYRANSPEVLKFYRVNSYPRQ
jgi:hypothetical protein